MTLTFVFETIIKKTHFDPLSQSIPDFIINYKYKLKMSSVIKLDKLPEYF